MFSIRTATPADAASIAEVQVETWKTTYRGIVPDPYLDSLSAAQRTPRWREHLAGSEHILVAECEGEVVGFISGGPIHEPAGAHDAELYAIYLLLKSQRVGTGTALLAELVTHLKAAGFRSMAVWVLEANRATRFYERSGAVRIGAGEREVGGALLPVVAYGWPSLANIPISQQSR